MSSVVDNFFLDNWIQAFKHQRKKHVVCMRDYVEKLTSFGYIPLGRLGQPMNFSADPRSFKLVLSRSRYF